MEKKEKVSAKAQVKVAKAAGSFVAIKGLDLEDGRRFEVGDKVEGLSLDQIAALTEMQAIAEEGE